MTFALCDRWGRRGPSVHTTAACIPGFSGDGVGCRALQSISEVDDHARLKASCPEGGGSVGKNLGIVKLVPVQQIPFSP